jgi:flavin reductase (DIM6/NTAB) family NADH-FMN oxidoreductase RutF
MAQQSADLVALDTSRPIWDRFFTVAPLVLVGTRDPDGAIDIAPKHMVTPMGWQNYFGFVCTPRHSTFQNIERTGQFTVSYPKPSQVLYASLAASPRGEEGGKPILQAFSTFPATTVDGALVQDGYLYLECEHFKTVDGFGENSLVTGRIVAASVDAAALRATEVDDQDLLHDTPMFVYLPPTRFASVERTSAFPFPADMKK